MYTPSRESMREHFTLAYASIKRIESELSAKGLFVGTVRTELGEITWHLSMLHLEAHLMALESEPAKQGGATVPT